MSETASLLAEHRFLNGGGESGLIFPVACACGLRTPGWVAWDAHVAAIIDAHFAERERALVERVEAVLDFLDTAIEPDGSVSIAPIRQVVATVRAALAGPATEGEG